MRWLSGLRCSLPSMVLPLFLSTHEETFVGTVCVCGGEFLRIQLMFPRVHNTVSIRVGMEDGNLPISGS